MAENRKVAIAINDSPFAENAFDFRKPRNAKTTEDQVKIVTQNAFEIIGKSHDNIKKQLLEGGYVHNLQFHDHKWQFNKGGYLHYMHRPENEVLCLHCPEFDVDKAQKEMAKTGCMKAGLERQYSKITELEMKYQQRFTKDGIRGRVLSIPSKHPGQTLVETSVEEKVFAIVMGTRGLSKLKKALLGSTSDYMMAHSEIPVIVVRKKD